MKVIDREEFNKQLKILCAGMDVPCTEEREEAYWKGLQQMQLSQFVRTVEFVLAKETWAKIPKPGQVWEAFRRMRTSGPPLPPKDDGFRGDSWDAAANRYLLGYLMRRFERNQPLPGTPASYRAMAADRHKLDVLGLDPIQLDASVEFVSAVHQLVAAKNLWAADMRDIAINGEVPVETQKQFWREYIAKAEQGATS